MADNTPKIGTRVEIVGKDVKGMIAFVGNTNFSAGKWFGVILDEPKGKNNGFVQGKSYFTCPDNYGMFVRQTQLLVLDDENEDKIKETAVPRTNSLEKIYVAKENEKRRMSFASTGIPKLSHNYGSRDDKTYFSSTSNSSLIERQTRFLPQNNDYKVHNKRKSISPSAFSTEKNSYKDTVYRRKSIASACMSKVYSATGTKSVGNMTGTLLKASVSDSINCPIGVPKSSTESEKNKAAFNSVSSTFSEENISFKETECQRKSIASAGISKLYFTTGTKAVEYTTETLSKASVSDPIKYSIDVSNSSFETEKIKTVTDLLTQKDQEIHNLKNEVKDLNDKLETIKIKRAEDQCKIKEAEKVKIQMKQLLEYKTKITEVQANLQKELAQAKKEATEAIEAKEQHAEDMSDLAEAMEMATLDKEMAEEKCESLQAELDQTKEKLEELQIDYEILKTEMTEKSDGTVTIYQLRQLEQQNERLKDMLLKMRDLSTHEKQEQQQMQKDLDNQKLEINELKREKEKLSLLVNDYEKQLGNLKEQLDTAIGSRELIEILTEKNFSLEDKVQELTLLIDDLEQLQDVNEQLQETAKETEFELREELKICNAKILENNTQLKIMEETIADCEQLIQKFRNQTEELRESNDKLQRELEKKSDEFRMLTSFETFDCKFKSAEAKSFAKTIEIKLSQIEVQDANQHVRYLCSFMPDHFMKRGSDHDAILTLLLFPRIIRKTEILVSHIQEKFPFPENILKDVDFKTQENYEYSFAYRLMYWLYLLQSLLHQYLCALNSCSVEFLFKMAKLYMDMAIQEKTIDYYIDLLRKDELHENINIQMLTKSVMYFENFYRIHLSTEKIECSVFLDDYMKQMNAATKSIYIDISTVIKFLDNDGQKSEFGSLLKDISNYSIEIQRFLRTIKRHIPTENDTTTLQFQAEIEKQLCQCRENISQVISVAYYLRNTAVAQMTISANVEFLNVMKLKEHAVEYVSKLYNKHDDKFECVQMSLSIVVSFMSELANAMRYAEYETEKSIIEKSNSPIYLRAKDFKEEAKNHLVLKTKLESRENDICELKKALKEKKDELSEMHVRKEMVNKKLEVAQRHADERVDRIQKQLDEATLLLKSKEREFEETLDHLQADIDALEKEKRELKDKIKFLSKNYTSEVSSKSNSFGCFEIAQKSILMSDPASTDFAVARNISFLSQQVIDLQIALQNLRNENSRLKGDRMIRQLENLPPLKIPLRPNRKSFTTGLKNTNSEESNNVEFEKIKTLSRECKNLLQKAQSIVLPTIVDITKRKPGTDPIIEKMAPKTQLVDSAVKRKNLQQESEKLANEIAKLRASSKQSAQFNADSSTFPLPFTIKPRNEENKLVARLTFPKYSNTETKTVPLLVTLNELNQLHEKLLL